MPSFKTCLASLVVLAFSFAPVVVASSVVPLQGFEHLSRRTPTSNFDVGMSVTLSRQESRKEAPTRAMAAKRRAAAKGKRSAAAAARPAPVVEKRAAAAAKVFSPASKAKFASYSATRCSQSKACALAQTKYGLPTAGTEAYCSNRKCTIICDAGFLGPQADGSCIASTVTCPTPPAHGIYSGASCTLTCDTAIGYEVVGSVCINVLSDIFLAIGLLYSPAIVSATPGCSGVTVINSGEILSGDALQIGTGNSNTNINKGNRLLARGCPIGVTITNSGEFLSGDAIQLGSQNSNTNVNANNKDTLTVTLGPTTSGSLVQLDNSGEILSGDAIQIGQGNSNTNINKGNSGSTA